MTILAILINTFFRNFPGGFSSTEALRRVLCSPGSSQALPNSIGFDRQRACSLRHWHWLRRKTPNRPPHPYILGKKHMEMFKSLENSIDFPGHHRNVHELSISFSAFGNAQCCPSMNQTRNGHLTSSSKNKNVRNTHYNTVVETIINHPPNHHHFFL